MRQASPDINLPFSRRPRSRRARLAVVTDETWLVAEREELGAYPDPTERAGKWLCFVALDQAGEIWPAVAAATRAGRLGSHSTLRSPREGYSGQVIEVRTYDWTDRADAMQVRDELRLMGFEAKMPYKAEADSVSGVYNETGFRGISKYYE